MSNTTEKDIQTLRDLINNAKLIGETLGVLRALKSETENIGQDPFSKLSPEEEQARIRSLMLIDRQIAKLEAWNG
jgi:hypothetical protein